jgi:hypothetical protein
LVTKCRHLFEDTIIHINVLDVVRPLNNMSWKEEFDEKSKEVNNWINQDGSTFETTGMSIKETKQFISDLRKKDEEELIKEVKRRWTTSDLELNMEQLIKDYYKD